MAEPVSASVRRRDLERLETVIEDGLRTFVQVGQALREIKERGLYQIDGYSTFAEYTSNRWGIGRHYAYRQMRASETVEVLENVDSCQQQLPANEAQARPLTSLDRDEQVEAWKHAVRRAEGEQPTSRHVREAVETLQAGSPQSVHYSSERTDWLTPPHVVERVVKVMGGVDLDPCASSAEEPNVPAERHFTKADDGLSRIWKGRVYLNPPYGEAIAEWTGKLSRSVESGDVEEAIALVPARTDTSWFRDFRQFPICFVRGRLRFSGHENSAPFPSAVVYVGDRNEGRFVEMFGGPNGIGDVFTLARE